jgi:hypothetical protein
MKAFLLIFLVAMSSKISAQKNNDSNECLIIGNGGGITGRWEFYKIKANGEVLYKANLTTDYEKIGKISKKSAESYFQQVADFKLDSLALNQPGNMSYLIELQDETSKHKALWSGNDAPKTLTEFYDSLLKTVSSKR